MTEREIEQVFQRPPPPRRNWRHGIRRALQVRGIPRVPALTRKQQERAAARQAARL